MSSYSYNILLPILALIIAFSTSSLLSPAYSETNVNYPVSIVFKAYNSTDPAFDPDPLHITMGDTVTWTNHDLVAHMVAHGTPQIGPETEFESPILTPNQSFSHTFTQAGTYPYYDQVHPWLTGTVIVGTERDPLPTITVESDKVYYQRGETIHISGRVANLTEDQPVTLQVFSPTGAAYRFDQIIPSTNGSFAYDLQISGPLGIHGDYTVKASYGSNTTQTGFRLLAPISSLAVNAILPDGTPLNMWTVIEFPTSEGNSHSIVGYTTSSFDLPQETTYNVTVHDYDGITFDHWSDGSSLRSRSVSLTENTTLTAIYSTNIVRGFTTLTYNGTQAPPNVTVQAQSLDNGQPLNMWTHIKAGPSMTSAGIEYTITVHNYQNNIFVRWEDGSTNPTRVLTASQATTITAYYQTG